MADQEITMLGPIVSEYILKQYGSQFGIDAKKLDMVHELS